MNPSYDIKEEPPTNGTFNWSITSSIGLKPFRIILNYPGLKAGVIASFVKGL